MDLHQLKLFNSLASVLSFSKAANLLYISQPAMSIQIKKFEDALGLKLIAKSGKKLSLTETGKTLYEYSREIFSLVEEAESAINSRSGHIAGSIYIGASNTPGTYILPRILGEFKEMYPNVNTSLHISSTFEIGKLAYENKIDFAVSGGDMTYGNDVHLEKLANDRIVFIASPANKMVQAGNTVRDILVHNKYIAHESNSQLYKLVDNIYEELGLPINIIMALGSIDAIKQAVAANLGISAVPASSITNDLKYNTLKQLEIKDKVWSYPYSLIYHNKRYLSPAAVKLIELIKERMRKMFILNES